MGKSAACVRGSSLVCEDGEFGEWAPLFEGLQQVDRPHQVGDVPALAGALREHLKDKVLQCEDADAALAELFRRKVSYQLDSLQ